MKSTELRQFMKDTATRKYGDHTRNLRLETIFKELLSRIESLEEKTKKRGRGRPRKRKAKKNDA